MKEHRAFWRRWIRRFELNSDELITPHDKLVVAESNNINVNGSRADRTKAMKAWDHVRSITDYDLSSEWKVPRETIQEATGDCEDFTFLLASIFPNIGIKESKLVIGDLIDSNGTPYFHTWNEVDGTVIDATGSPEAVATLTYREVHSWVIRA